MDILKAAGTPMTKPLPVSSLARLTLVPGEHSCRTSRFGRLSPTLTLDRADAWKRAARGCGGAGADEGVRRRAVVARRLQRAEYIVDGREGLLDSEGLECLVPVLADCCSQWSPVEAATSLQLSSGNISGCVIRRWT